MKTILVINLWVLKDSNKCRKTGRHTFYICQSFLAQVEEVHKIFLVWRPAQQYLNCWEISKILSYFILPMECWWIKLSDQFLLNLFQFLKKKSLTTRIPGWFTMTSKIEHLNETLLKVHIKYFQSFKLKWNRNLSKHFEWFSFDHKYNSEER